MVKVVDYFGEEADRKKTFCLRCVFRYFLIYCVLWCSLLCCFLSFSFCCVFYALFRCDIKCYVGRMSEYMTLNRLL